MAQKIIEYLNNPVMYPADYEFNLDTYRKQTLENICFVVEQINKINPEVALGQRDDLIEELPDNMIRWRTDVLLQYDEVQLRVFLNFFNRRAKQLKDTYGSST